jgi:CheY-like chemotaxis protein
MTDLVLDTEVTPEQREYLDAVRQSADSLLTLLDDILDFSKIEAGKLDLEPVEFELRDTLGDAVKSLAIPAHEKGLELAYHVAPDVPDALGGDPVRLRQIVVNLVGNAIKFTERGEVVVRVAAESYGDDEARLHFAVTDTGAGIPAEQHAFIFEAFSQADGSSTRRHSGTGLGLAISAELVALMGGRIWVESEAGGGSTFHFTARFGLQREAKPTPRATPPPSLEGLPVLVVDDNATNGRILVEMLGNWNMAPKLAHDGESALAAMGRARDAGEPIALVLLDADMPGTDALALARHISRSSHGARDTIIMMLTSVAPRIAPAERAELGIAVCLTKPIRQSDLLDAIASVFGLPVLREEPQEAPGEPPAAGIRRPLHILLAEDNAVNQRLAVRMLEKRGHSVVVANNGDEALAAWQMERFDLILMDVQMPEMDGFEATAAIREAERQYGNQSGTAAHVPIVALTAHAMMGDRERCLEAGMDGYVSKPIRPEALDDTIESLVGAAPGKEAEPRQAEVKPGAGGTEDANSAFDPNALMANVDGDPELLSEVVETFSDECPRLLSDVRRAVAEGDARGLERAAHTLKGLMGIFGAETAKEAALRLESIGQAGDLRPAGEACAALEQHIERLMPEVAALVEEQQQ